MTATLSLPTMQPKQFNGQQLTRISMMTKPIGPSCNIDCSYCYYLSKQELLGYEKGCRPAMDEQALEGYIQRYIESQNCPEIVFHWQGGEPTLLGLGFFRDVVRLQKKYQKPGVRIENNLQTNGTLLTDEWGRFLKKNNFLVGISIDGPEMVHNTYRTNRAGRGTFRQTMAGLKVLQKHQVNFATLTCVNDISAKNALEIYRFLRDVVKSPQMQFIPIVEPKSFRKTAPQHWSAAEMPFQGAPEADPSHPESVMEPWCVSAEQWGEFLCTIFDEWFAHDVGRVNVPYFEACVETWMGRINPLCSLAPMCGKGLAMESNGDVFACDHYVYPEFKIGNLFEDDLADMAFSPTQEKFGKDKEGTLPSQCRKCAYQFACFGECPKNRVLKTLTGEPGLNYLCAGWRRFFAHIDPCISVLVQSLGHQVHRGIAIGAGLARG